MITSGLDYQILFWDLFNLQKPFKPFRTIEPQERQIITSLSLSTNGKLILVTAGCKPKIYDRDGQEIIEFIIGNMSFKDLLYTKGHIQQVTHGQFDMNQTNICYTSSLDGSIRIWDLNQKPFGIERQLACKQTIKVKNSQLKKVEVNKLIQQNEKLIIGFCQDKSIRCFDPFNNYIKPCLEMQSDFLGQVSSVCKLNLNEYQFITRELDDSVKLFDIRNFITPVQFFKQLNNCSEFMGICILPEDKIILTGTTKQKNSNSQFCCINTETQEIFKIDIGDLQPQVFYYNQKFKHLFMSTNETLNILCDPNALDYIPLLKSINKQPKIKQLEEYTAQQIIYTPNINPCFKQDEQRKRKRFDKIRLDEKLTQKPMQMLTGPGYKGLISEPRTNAQFVMKTIHEIKNKETNIVDKIMSEEKENQSKPVFIDTAYLITQPVKKLDTNYQESNEGKLMSLFSKCKHCGLKICQCDVKRGVI